MVHFQLPEISYEGYSPVISPETMKVHHSKHHQTYINNFKNLVEQNHIDINKEWSDFFLTLNTYPPALAQGLKNQAGGHFNHCFFWNCLKPIEEVQIPSSQLKEEIEKTFSSFEKFQELMENAGKAQFGSGFVWLIKNKEGLKIISTPNQNNPLMEQSCQILLAIDVWEHAYYLTYQSDRAQYLKDFWKICSWDFVSKNFEFSLS